MAKGNPASVLVDSNIFIGLLRRKQDPVRFLGEWMGAGDLVTCGIVRVEVLRGMKVPKARDFLQDFLDVLVNVPTTNKLWEEAAQLAWALDRRGHKLPLQDILIAVSALSVGAAVLTDDSHFLEIPGITVLLPAEEFGIW